MTHIFPRVLDRELPEAVAADGAWITTADGHRFLDAAGGAIVVNVGHGERAVIDAMTAQLG
ncbi:MAG: aspartate aminotransferase family protein, partial [Actinomycetota bacterium]|nr:aspartate aminotransferase family protein [Actinomycetota bacterium]